MDGTFLLSFVAFISVRRHRRRRRQQWERETTTTFDKRERERGSRDEGGGILLARKPNRQIASPITKTQVPEGTNHFPFIMQWFVALK